MDFEKVPHLPSTNVATQLIQLSLHPAQENPSDSTCTGDWRIGQPLQGREREQAKG